MSSVLLVPTGTANLASVAAAFARQGVDVALSLEPDAVESAPAVVLPGVGHFAAAMRTLTETGLDAALRSRVAAGRPTLAICLGFQLLCATSEEAQGVPGLGLIPCGVERFPKGVRTPHLGWTKVVADDGCRLLSSGWASFAHSYRLTTVPPGWRAARATHGAPFVAALERGPVLACQLHPELSGAWGAGLLSRWLAAAGLRRAEVA